MRIGRLRQDEISCGKVRRSYFARGRLSTFKHPGLSLGQPLGMANDLSSVVEIAVVNT